MANPLRVFFKYISFIILLFEVSVFGQEQENIDELNKLIDELFFNEQDSENFSPSSKNLIYTNIGFNSNTFYAGRSSGLDQFNAVPQLTYLNESGILLNFAGVYLSEVNPEWDVSRFSIGYSVNFGNDKNWGASVSAARFFYTTSAEDIFNKSLSIGLNYQSKNENLFVFSNFNWFFGNNKQFQFQTHFSYRFSILGNQNQKVLTNGSGDKPMNQANKSEGFGLSFIPMLSLYVNRETLSTEYNALFFRRLITITEEQDIFGLINTQLQFPIVMSYKNFDLELGYIINFPRAIIPSDFINNTHFFSLSIGHSFLF